jgi:hypothetical protein
LRGTRRLSYADSRMKDFLLTLLHLAVTTAKVCGPGGGRAVIAKNLVLKQQLIVLRRGRRRAPSLAMSDRLLCGFGSLPQSRTHRKVAYRPSPVVTKKSVLLEAVDVRADDGYASGRCRCSCPFS